MTSPTSIPFHLQHTSGLLTPGPFIPSLNHDRRPAGAHIDTLVIHAISLPKGVYGNDYIAQFFTNCLDCTAHPSFAQLMNLKVSAHFLIQRSGALIQFVRTHLRAWHAGESSFCGRANVNNFSLGVELEGCDDEPFEDAQYEMLTNLAMALLCAYPAITPAHIVAHSDIAPNRKTDPGPHFDWQRLRTGLATNVAHEIA